MNWPDYLVLAKGLAEHPFEASRRSAVSRAYYAVFNSCRRWLEANVTSIDNRGAHEQVWETFKRAEHANEPTRSTWRLIGTLGDSLRSLRNQADYDEGVADLDLRAPYAVGSAERIYALLGELELAD
ncbi:MAG TPA: hypothetical protein VGI17_16730 [Solirubrobacterales bacterium]